MKNYTRRGLLGLLGCAALFGSTSRPTLASGEPYARRVLSKGPVAYWRFEERIGPLADDSTTAKRNGTYEGNVVLGQQGAITSEPDLAIGLDGRTAYVEVANDPSFSVATSGKGLTVEAWMRPDALTFAGQTSQRYIHWLGKGEHTAFEWGFRFYSQDSPTRPNRISAYIWNPASTSDASNEGAGAYFQDQLHPGQWIHVVACYDPGDASDPNAGVSLYKNGQLRAGPKTSRGARYASYSITPRAGPAPLRLGTLDLQSFFNGGLDEVALYPRVLSADEILDNYLGA